MNDLNLENIITEQCIKARKAVEKLAVSSLADRNNILAEIARLLSMQKNIDEIIEANKKDVDNAQANGIKESMVDRLIINEKRIEGMIVSINKTINLPDPLGKGDLWTRPNGLVISRIRVPLGLCGLIYESRPNVTIDAAVLCIKSGNGAILKGGKEAVSTSEVLCRIIGEALEACGFSKDCVQLIFGSSRESANVMMKLDGYIDVLIPRGSASLIKSVVKNSSVPVIETGAGNCHIYVDSSADFEMALKIIKNAKTRPSVCNSVETVLVSESIAEKFLPELQSYLLDMNIKYYGCEKSCAVMEDINPASEEDYFTEYNDYILAVKVVPDVKAAVEHINRYNTKHSEAIVTSNIENAEYFKKYIDAAAVYVNASTWFTDGEQFGFGAEIGISTSKLHARGPLGLNELTTVKYLIDGNGQIR